jgi:hypothetical protein
MMQSNYQDDRFSGKTAGYPDQISLATIFSRKGFILEKTVAEVYFKGVTI